MTTFSDQRSRAMRRQLIEYVTATRSPNPRRSLGFAGVLVLAGATLGSTVTAAAFTIASNGQIAQGEQPAFTSGTGNVFGALAEQPGFVGGGIQPNGTDLEVSWDGELGPAALTILAEAAHQGVTVHVVHVGHSPRRLWTAATTIVAALADAGIDVSGFGPDRYYRTIELMGPGLSTDPALQARAKQIASATVGDAYQVAFIANEGSPVLFPAPPSVGGNG